MNLTRVSKQQCGNNIVGGVEVTWTVLSLKMACEVIVSKMTIYVYL